MEWWNPEGSAAGGERPPPPGLCKAGAAREPCRWSRAEASCGPVRAPGRCPAPRLVRERLPS
ncbi:hypothetical protein PSMK_12300 [Phycisphaera mikurensis NBRC 102666]|uniref:Uncharacterized protein n=1 Tax=Phycisphaera mikurensis (strain NBRC 102666 / KCTC 22515 / FYK2301M01) TaxID=1142394 RepID=I0IDQ1_PHYMF|nr:hypothetical protein PSMK_12300 [Phycisphaera mikurensis NBRC 102666]